MTNLEKAIICFEQWELDIANNWPFTVMENEMWLNLLDAAEAGEI